jgi:hypothetical protein
MILIFGLNSHFTYLVNSTDKVKPLVKKVFRLTLNFTRCLTYITRALYELCHETLGIIAI